jgi:hypothetical protein
VVACRAKLNFPSTDVLRVQSTRFCPISSDDWARAVRDEKITIYTYNDDSENSR